MAKGITNIYKKGRCINTCPPGTKLNPVTCDCVKIVGVEPPKGKKGMIIKSKKK